MAKPNSLPNASQALPGRAQKIVTAATHFVTAAPLHPPFPEDLEQAVFGLGCFWGAERVFWQAAGVWSTSVGYAGGITPNPTYEEVCSGGTGHTEVVRVIFDPKLISYAALARLFFESHDPTQGMRQGGDTGTQYRSAIYTASAAQLEIALSIRAGYDAKLRAAGHGPITTEVCEAGEFYYAEAYHQQYLAKNPNGYCGIGGVGLSCPISG
jgi:peptide-methionine (S)-S-oxide reductase